MIRKLAIYDTDPIVHARNVQISKHHTKTTCAPPHKINKKNKFLKYQSYRHKMLEFFAK